MIYSGIWEKSTAKSHDL
ncbi:hypothetical protein Gotur_035254 [Gossypium turneri]